MADDPDTRPRPTPLMPPSFFTKEPRHLDSPMEWSTSLLRPIAQRLAPSPTRASST
jgi:hypothetical protein